MEGRCACQNLLESSYEKSFDDQEKGHMNDLISMPPNEPSVEGFVSLADFLLRAEERSLLVASCQAAGSSLVQPGCSGHNRSANRLQG